MRKTKQESPDYIYNDCKRGTRAHLTESKYKMNWILCFSVVGLFVLVSVKAQVPEESFTDWKCPSLSEEEDDKPKETLNPECLEEVRLILKKENKQLKKQLLQCKQDDSTRMENNNKKLNEQLLQCKQENSTLMENSKILYEQLLECANSTWNKDISKINHSIDNLIITSGSGEKGNSTDIWQAARYGNLPAVVFYLNQDATLINKLNEVFKTTPLIYASLSGHLEIVKFLVRRGADINGVDSHNNTALMSASSLGHTSIVEYLISVGADVNLQGDYKWTALHYALHGANLDVINVLLKNGVDPNLKDEDGHTIFDAFESASPDIIKKLFSSRKYIK